MNRKWIIILFLLLIFSAQLQAVVTLPNGTPIYNGQTSSSGGRMQYVKLREPMFFNTLLGRLQLMEIRFFNDYKETDKFMKMMSSIVLYQPRLISTYLGNLKLTGASFYKDAKKRDKTKKMLSGIKLFKPKLINTPIGKIKLQEIKFFKNGKISGVELLKPKTIDTTLGQFKIFGSLNFHTNNNIKSIRLYEDTTINGKLFEENSILYWDKDNKYRKKAKIRAGP